MSKKGASDALSGLRDELNSIKTGSIGILASKGIPKLPAEFKAQELELRVRRILKGHFAKIYAVQWNAADCTHLVSASQDGKMLIWNASTTNKAEAIPLRSAWVMTCAYSPSGEYVACGGLDNVCAIYRANLRSETGLDTEGVVRDLVKHEGYLSSVRFIDDAKAVTASGDGTVILWDIPSAKAISVYEEHTADVMSVAVGDKGDNVLISGSVDMTVKLWDIRAPAKSKFTFWHHDSDVNSVDFHSGTKLISSGSDDTTCAAFDIRSLRVLNKFASDSIVHSVTSVKFSKSSRYMFSGYDDQHARAWDTLTGKILVDMTSHEERVSCLDVCPDGSALCTGSWDTMLKVWA